MPENIESRIELQFRLMQEADLAMLVDLLAASSTHAWTLEQIRTSLTNPHEQIWLACNSRNDEIVACAFVQSILDESELLNLCVTRRLQQQGFGREILDVLITKARDAGQSTIFLEVRRSHLAAIGLYESAGFNKIGIRKNYYPGKDENREDAVVYSLPLSSSLSLPSS